MPAKRNVIDTYRACVRPVVQKYSGPNGERKYTYWQCDYVEAGNRKRRKFQTKAAAQQWAVDFAKRRSEGREILELTTRDLRDAHRALRRLEEQDTEGRLSLEKSVDVALMLSEDNARDARDALNILAKSGKRDKGLPTLKSAVQFAVDNLPNDPSGGSKPLGDAVAEYIAQAEHDGLRPKSLESIRSRLVRFCDSFPGDAVSDAAREVDTWLRELRDATGKDYAPRTLHHYRTVLGGFWEWCKKQGWVAENPARGSKCRRGHRILTDEAAPGVLTPEQAETVLRICERDYPEILPAVALGMFCGLRRGEIERIRWDAVNFASGVLTVGPKVAKTRSIRVVELQPAALAWLLPYRRTSGPVVPEGVKFEMVFRQVRRHARMNETWPHNALRHSFASYHLATFQDAAKTALQLGHVGGLGVLFNHYRGLVTRQQAETFWNIRPAGPAKVIQIGVAS